MNERLKTIRKELSLSQEAFGKKLGVTGAGISKIESGNRNLTEQMILAICREFHVREEWLRKGTGEMFLDLTEDEFSKAAATLSNDPFVRSLIIEYWKLNEDNKKLFRNFIHNLSNNMQVQETTIKKTIISAESEISATEDNFWKNCTIEEAEEKYIKNSSHSVKKKGSPVLNITAGTEKKVANQ